MFNTISNVKDLKSLKIGFKLMLFFLEKSVLSSESCLKKLNYLGNYPNLFRGISVIIQDPNPAWDSYDADRYRKSRHALEEEPILRYAGSQVNSAGCNQTISNLLVILLYRVINMKKSKDSSTGKKNRSR